MSRQIDLIVFDLDGTLIDAYDAVYNSIKYTLKGLGMDSNVEHEYVKRAVGWGDRHFVRQFSGDERIDEAMKLYREHHKEALREGTTFLPGAKELLEKLKKQGYMLAVATNRPSPYTHIVLNHLDMENTFDYVLCGDEVENAKPAPDILYRILEKFSVPAERALYVGDMTIDVLTGNAAGVKTVAVITGSSLEDEIIALNPLKVIFNVHDVLNVLDGLNLSEEIPIK